MQSFPVSLIIILNKRSTLSKLKPKRSKFRIINQYLLLFRVTNEFGINQYFMGPLVKSNNFLIKGAKNKMV